jgi:hypothetical protein
LRPLAFLVRKRYYPPDSAWDKEDVVKKIGLICIAIVVVFLLSNVASATKWKFVGHYSDGHNGEEYAVYVDTDSVIRDGDTLSCWVDLGFGPDTDKTNLSKLEFKLTSPVQYRVVEIYVYDWAQGPSPQPGKTDFYDSAFTTLLHPSTSEKVLAAARKHAKNGKMGKDNTPKPAAW